jgi:hypothetical protein
MRDEPWISGWVFSNWPLEARPVVTRRFRRSRDFDHRRGHDRSVDSGADQLLPFAILLFTALVVVVAAVVALIRSNRVPGPGGDPIAPPHEPKR